MQAIAVSVAQEILIHTQTHTRNIHNTNIAGTSPAALMRENNYIARYVVLTEKVISLRELDHKPITVERRA